MRRELLGFAVPVLALCLVLGGCGGGEQAAPRTAQAERGVVEELVEDTGAVAYRDPYSIIPVVSGKITACTFEEGDRVAEGQTLYVIDSTGLEDQITQARLSLESAELSYAQSLDACGDLTVHASAGGSVTAVYCHVGDYVSAGTRVADLVDRANLKLTAAFAPADAAVMAPGSAAEVTFSNYSGAVGGTVKRVYDASQALEGGREGVYVEITFPNPGALSAGDSALATVGTAACMEAGRVDYGTEQSIFATQSGQVLTLPIEVGSAVADGQTVMTIENAALVNAGDNAKLARDTAEVALRQLEAKREDYVISAPVEGVILSRAAKAGDFAAAASSMATLVQESAMCVNVDVDELYVSRVWPGQEAEVTFTDDGGNTRTYAARVRRVDDGGTVSGGVTSYTVELTLDTAEGLRAGMNVSAAIVTARKADCLRVPAEAVSGDAVRVLRDGKTVETPVSVGVTGGGYTEILDGLAEGETVVLPR